MDSNGSNETRLTHDPGGDLNPDWSPDGTRIAFDSTRNGTKHVYVMNADGSEKIRLTSFEKPSGQPAWSPDGSKIVFYSNRDGNAKIFVMNADGSNPTSLIGQPARGDIDPSWGRTAGLIPTVPPPPTPVDVVTLELIPGRTFLLKDDETEVSLRHVHDRAYRSDGVRTENGLPYVTIGDAWLEIVNSTTIANRGYIFKIDNLGCGIERKNQEDYIYNSLESCTVQVQTTIDENLPGIEASPFERSISLNDRYAMTFSTVEADQLLAIRFLGFSIGNVDRESEPWVVRSVNGGLDVITHFGVKNIDLDLNIRPIIGHTEQFFIGPQLITLEILDVANTNSRCDPVCRNVFDIKLVVENPPSPIKFPVRVLEYK